MYIWIHWYYAEYISITQLHNYFSANVHVGDACSFQQQCNGTDHSGVCSNGFCQCQQGYLQKDETCYRGTQMKKIDNFVTKEVSYETNICTYGMQIVGVKNISFFKNMFISVMCCLNSLIQAQLSVQKPTTEGNCSKINI